MTTSTSITCWVGTVCTVAAAGLLAVSGVFAAVTADHPDAPAGPALTAPSIRLPEASTSPVILASSAAGGLLVGAAAVAARGRRDHLPGQPAILDSDRA